MRAARQQHGELSFTTINDVQYPLALIAMALLPVIVWLAWRKRLPAAIGELAATVTLALVGQRLRVRRAVQSARPLRRAHGLARRVRRHAGARALRRPAGRSSWAAGGFVLDLSVRKTRAGSNGNDHVHHANGITRCRHYRRNFRNGDGRRAQGPRPYGQIARGDQPRQFGAGAERPQDRRAQGRHARSRARTRAPARRPGRTRHLRRRRQGVRRGQTGAWDIAFVAIEPVRAADDRIHRALCHHRGHLHGAQGFPAQGDRRRRPSRRAHRRRPQVGLRSLPHAHDQERHHRPRARPAAARP